MEELRVGLMSRVIGYLVILFRRCLFYILSKGPIPSHLAFIMDGNRRFARKLNLDMAIAHRAGFSALLSMLKYCCELGVKHVTFYAFSIDNFRRRPDEVHILMDLMVEKSEGMMRQKSIVDEYGIRVLFLGNLKLLSKEVQLEAEKVMKATSCNTKCMLLICVAYTSTDEIRYTIQQSCIEKSNKLRLPSPYKGTNGMVEQQTLESNTNNNVVSNGVHETLNNVLSGMFLVEKALQKHCSNIKLVDIEKNMYMAVAPDPDILIRTSGETRLSNFLSWQTSYCLLYSPETLWPEIGQWELTWAILSYQRNQFYLEKKKKQC